MSDDAQTVTEPVDDATLVHDEVAEEKAHDELVSDVTKLLDKTPVEDGTKPDEAKPDLDEEKPSEDEKPKDDEPAELSDELQVRAEGAGLSTEFAQRLHQTGQLEETLAAFDRAMIERFQSKKTDDSGKAREPDRREQGKALEKPPQKAEDQEGEADLDPEVYDEGLVKRDAYHKGRIDALESQVAELVQERRSAFDERFDAMVDDLGHKGLFGKGASVPKDKQANRDKLFPAYRAVCQAYDVDPNKCDPEWGKRALAAMFPKEVFKQTQKQTFDRLKDAQGKFLSPSRPGRAPPARGATEEEVHGQLVSDVDAYLNKKGVKMSGV